MEMIGIGIDIIEIERIRHSIERGKQTFLSKIYTDEEMVYCEAKKLNKYESYAARFAAKEAFAKALPDELKDQVSWKDVAVGNKESGRPFILLSDHAKKCIPKNWHYLLSLSHNKSMATAMVYIQKRTDEIS